MKEFFINLALFVVFSIAFSSLSGCSGTANSEPGKTDQKPQTSGNTAAESKPGSESKSSEYPPLVASIAQADLEMIDGSVIKPADRKGKVILLNLWGIWCGPCRVEMPHLVEMQEKYRDKDFQVIGLNIGDGDFEPEDVGNIKAFAEKMKLNYELARIPRSTTDEFMKFTKFGGVPQSLLVDREGHLRGVFLGGGPSVIGKMKETVDKVVNE